MCHLTELAQNSGITVVTKYSYLYPNYTPLTILRKSDLSYPKLIINYVWS
jgi:hypothetical protein